MADREKVVKAIEICYFGEHNCTECELFYVEDCNDKLMRDALELLKPVEPIEERLNEIDCIYRCGNCKTHFYYRQQKYCAICGRMAKWDGRH